MWLVACRCTTTPPVHKLICSVGSWQAKVISGFCGDFCSLKRHAQVHVKHCDLLQKINHRVLTNTPIKSNIKEVLDTLGAGGLNLT